MKVTKVPAPVPLPPPPTFSLTDLSVDEARVVRVALANLKGSVVAQHGLSVQVLQDLRVAMDRGGCSMSWGFCG